MHAVIRGGLVIGLVLALLAPSGNARVVAAEVGPQHDTADRLDATDSPGADRLVGRPAPDLVLPSLRPGNDPITLADHRGKVVFLDFWSSWCAPCRRAMPHLDALRRQFSRDDLEVVGVNVDPLADDALRFLEQVPVSYPIASDPTAAAAGRFGVSVLPALVVVDRAGVVRDAMVGDVIDARDELRATLAELIEEREVQ